MPVGLLPEALFTRLCRQRFPFWLDSGPPSHPGSGGDGIRRGRFSFMGCDPYRVLQVDAASSGPEGFARVESALAAELAGPGWHGDPDKEWERLAALFPPGDAPPFLGGAVGYLGYDLGAHLEGASRSPRRDLALPEAFLAFYDLIAVFDHATGSAFWVSTGKPFTGEAAGRRAGARLAAALRLAREAPAGPSGAQEPASTTETVAGFAPDATWLGRYRGLGATFDEAGYRRAVAAAKAYIAAGDVYQVNLAQRFSVRAPGPAAEAFLRLRRVNPAPFAAYLGGGEWAVASLSPERFLRLRPGRVETEPIKGTRPRGNGRADDAALAQELRDSAKDRAEHVMIVDLERNDLGRFCEFGSVRVEAFCRLEAHPTVWHLVSTVAGRPRPGTTPADCLRHTFPGGSITGAPKIRAMQIIAELEPVCRGVYTGAIGYFGLGGRMDLNIAIRTVVLADGWAHFHVGGAIVADSDPAREYAETLHKGAGILRGLVEYGLAT